MRQGKRRRARNIAIAALLATATAGATIAGLTAANADENRFTDSGFDLLKAPGEGDPSVEGIGWAAGGDESWNEVGAQHQLVENIKLACIEAGFTDFKRFYEYPHTDFGGWVARPGGGVQIFGTGDCSKFWSDGED